VLSLNVGSGGGLTVQQDSADPSARAGRGFAHFFGLNDLVSRPTPLFFENGVDGTDLHGLVAGGEISYQVRDANGRFIADRTVSISGALTGPASNWNNLLASLNAPGTGLGDFGAFALDAATGRLSFNADPAFQVSLIGDSTSRGATGVSLTALHGIGAQATSGRALDADVNEAIAANPNLLAVAKPDIAAALGQKIIEAGDNRGAAALRAARDTVRSFASAGLLAEQSTTLGVYAARLGGEAGRLATDAKRAATGAQAVAAAAGNRRAEIEGVSLDDELLKMTTFQNAYAAAARVIQAATEMLDVLMSIGYR
jgi:flagellar hook-associated protein 1